METKKIISFDVFDTLITRRTIFPRGIFLVVRQKLYKENGVKEYSYFCNNFYCLRVAAELDARKFARKRSEDDITLTDIYNVLTKRANIPTEIAQRVMQIEIAAEIEYSYPIYENIKQVKTQLEEGHRVVLISDMYLDVEVIRAMLSKWDAVFKDIPIYVSGQFKRAKRNGLLYFDVAREEKAEFKNWIHFGDNAESDYAVPRMLGIDARLVKFTEMTSWENDLGEALNIQENLMLQYIIGTARILRIENKLDLMGTIGGSLGAMILYPYVSWLIHNSLQLGINRLYFIARDGFVLKRIADAIIAKQHLDIETKYIYGSRKAWRESGLSDRDKILVKKYIQQEVDVTDANYAFVELHGSGNSVKSLARLIRGENDEKIKAFYLDITDEATGEDYQFFSFTTKSLHTAEFFCRAKHGVTIGYKEEEENIIPRISMENNALWETADIEGYFQGVDLFVDKILEVDAPCDMDDINIIETAVLYCDNNPCEEIREFLGMIPHTWNLLDEKVKEVQPSEVPPQDITSYIENGQRIILYGAGRIGQRLYKKLTSESNVKVVGWADKNYEKCTQLGCVVTSLVEAIKNDFDYIVIAIADINAQKMVYNLLQEFGINGNRILDYMGHIIIE